MSWLVELQLLLKEKNIPKKNVCIVGSCVMTTYGIRANHDIDIVLTSDQRRKYGAALYKLNSEIEMVHQNWGKYQDGTSIDDDMLISNPDYHFWFAGFRFARLELLYIIKLLDSREKDKLDLKLIKPYIDENHSIYTSSWGK